jgi:diketogulonate reductase-like aldo/keto reductase
MCADGGAEKLVGKAIAGRRDEVFLVSKVLPRNATRGGTIAACERSLRRLGTDHLDLYLLHWRGRTPLRETIDAFEALLDADKIRHWGVSNFDVSDMEELVQIAGGFVVGTDQVLYNSNRRGIEYEPAAPVRAAWCPHHGVCGDRAGRLLNHAGLQRVAARHHATTAQVALAWVLRQDKVIAIPRAALPEHVKENRAALKLRLTDRDLAELDREFPPTAGPQPLEML